MEGIERSQRETFRRRFALQHGLRPIGEVTRAWNERSGEKPITRGRVLQILKTAEAKFAAVLENEWAQQDSNL